MSQEFETGSKVRHKYNGFTGIGVIKKFDPEVNMYEVHSKNKISYTFAYNLELVEIMPVKVKKLKKSKLYTISQKDYMLEEMFKEKGWEKVESISQCDLVVLPGGRDISPAIYSHATNIKTQQPNHDLDQKEISMINVAKKMSRPVVGICRGGQILHALNGGYLFQHVNNHTALQGHNATYLGKQVRVSSSHHQMMGDPSIGEVLAYSSIATEKEVNKFHKTTGYGEIGYDIEVMYYPKTNQLSFQPHPEYNGFTGCRKIFFQMVKTLLEK